MPDLPSSSSDPVLEARILWERRKKELAAGLIVILVALAAFGGYRFYIERRDAAAAEMMTSAKTATEYQELIAKYPDAPATAGGYLLLAAAQRGENKFSEANATLQAFIDKNPKHELVATARMAMAANLESLGKPDAALATYQGIAAEQPDSFNAPLALFSEVPLLKAKNQIAEARHVCETILTQYRESFIAGEAGRQLRMMRGTEPAPAALAPPAANPQVAPSAAPTTAKPKR
jgi:predicted negative regulator of RcsB-dependent stress response